MSLLNCSFLLKIGEQRAFGSKWSDIESLLIAVGAEVTEGNGSRVRVALNGGRVVFHRPHPRTETDRGALRSVRTFLRNVGVEPE